MKKYIIKRQLEEKIKTFISKKSKTLNCPIDINLNDEFLRILCETKEGYIFESTFCNGYQHEKYLLALSTQIGCATKCKFCGLGDCGLKKNLTENEILDQISILINRAHKRGYNIYDKPLKVTFVMGGEPLSNHHMVKALKRMAKEIPLQTKISTIFPDNEKSWSIYKEIVNIAKEYPNIIQFQISLNSTDKDYRQELVSIPLIDFKKIKEAGELWFKEVPNPRKIDLTFTISEETPINPDQIKDILSPNIFAIRLRNYTTTKTGKDNGFKTIEKDYLKKIASKFEKAGYLVIPGMIGHIEKDYSIAPGNCTCLNFYNKLKEVSRKNKIVN